MEMYCRKCNHHLRDLPTPVCHEYGRGFDPDNPRTFVASYIEFSSRMIAFDRFVNIVFWLIVVGLPLLVVIAVIYHLFFEPLALA